MKSIFLVLAISISTLAFADKDRGGGDSCEARIKEIREDLKVWISNGGHKKLVLPVGVTHQQYSTAMLHQISIAKIRCVGPNDSGFPVQIDETPKVCIFDKAPTESQITCDREQFLTLPATGHSAQHILVHHEYAGLAGIESPDGDDSEYSISNQLSAEIGTQLVQRLNVTERKSDDFPGWRKLDGLDGVLASKKLHELLSHTEFKNCSMAIEWTNESSFQRTCEGQTYRNAIYFIEPVPNRKNEPAHKVWAGYFTCNSKNGSSDVSFLIKDEESKTKIRQFSKRIHYPQTNEFLGQDIVYQLNASATQIESMTLTFGGGVNKKLVCLAK